MPSRIFICDRRAGGQDWGRLIGNVLQNVISEEELFVGECEWYSLEPSGDSADAATAEAVDVLVLVIDKGWLNARYGVGRRLLDDPSDRVRVAIEKAFAAGLRVIPVLAGGAVALRAADLPESLRPLTQLPAVAVDESNLKAVVSALFEEAKAGMVASLPPQGAAGGKAGTAETPLPALPWLATDTADELEYWGAIQDMPTEIFLRSHLARYPDGVTETMARMALERVVWQGLVETPDREKARAFLAEFPLSVHADEARAMILALRQQEALAAAAQQQQDAEMVPDAPLVDEAIAQETEEPGAAPEEQESTPVVLPELQPAALSEAMPASLAAAHLIQAGRRSRLPLAAGSAVFAIIIVGALAGLFWPQPSPPEKSEARLAAAPAPVSPPKAPLPDIEVTAAVPDTVIEPQPSQAASRSRKRLQPVEREVVKAEPVIAMSAVELPTSATVARQSVCPDTAGAGASEGDAFETCLEAARAGDTDAKYRVAALYRDGSDPQRDYKAAYWLYAALQDGNQQAREELRSNSAAWPLRARIELQKLLTKDGHFNDRVGGTIGPVTLRAIDAVFGTAKAGTRQAEAVTVPAAPAAPAGSR